MNIDYNDKKTWDLIKSGKSKCIFQLESNLAQGWLRKIKPDNLNELSAFVALLRPGCLSSGYTKLYAEHKNGKPFESFGHPIIDNIFASTQHVMCFQEQLMLLGAKLAWPDVEENKRLLLVDDLRKSVGKKDQKKILAIGKIFVEGCTRNNVDLKISEKLFNNIKECGRYLFNSSHSMAYAYLAYETAYLKANYPLEFLSTYLTYAEERLDKWQEIKDIYAEMSEFGIKLLPPNFNSKNLDFTIEGDSIRYGLRHIKSVGSQIQHLVSIVPQVKNWREWLKLMFTSAFGIKLRSTSAIALISSGAFSDIGISRSLMLKIYNHLLELSPKEMLYILENIRSISELSDLPGLLIKCKNEVSTQKRESIIESISKILSEDINNSSDDFAYIENLEKEYLGVALTSSSSDKSTYIAPDTIYSCYGDHKEYSSKHIKCVIDEINLRLIRTGPNEGKAMALLDIRDGTGILKGVPIFSEAFESYKSLIRKQNVVCMLLSRGKNGWIINKVYQEEQEL